MKKKDDLKTLKIMPLGDSITYDNDLRDCETPRPIGDRIAYRFKLYKLLKEAGYNFTFVGNRRAGYNIFPEANNAGFPGCTAKQLAELLRTGYNKFDKKYEVKGKYLEKFKPNIILLHIGTNHVNETSVNDINDILNIIQEYQKSKNGNPVTIFLARIIDYDPHNPDVKRLNNEVDELVKKRRDMGDTIIQVDMEKALDYSRDMADKFHPNPTGYDKMAQKWFEALDAWFKL